MIYFDITDIIAYAQAHQHVSGIQRVQIRVLQEIHRLHGNHDVRCGYRDAITNRYHAACINDLFPEADGALQVVLKRVEHIRSGWPLSKVFVRSHLTGHQHHKIRRGIVKARMYAAAFLRMLATPGKLRTRARVVRQLQPRDTLVFLGASQLSPELLSFVAQHRQQGGRVIQMMHDLIPHFAPQFFPPDHRKSYEHFLRDALNYATDFICVSRSTERDLRTLPHHPGTQIVTIPLAHEFSGFQRGQRGITSRHPHVLSATQNTPYVVCVGTIEIRKNGVQLLEAWRHLIRDCKAGRQPPPPHLIFAGKSGWQTESFFRILEARPELAQHVSLLPDCSDQDLAYLYEHCLFTIYPSLYEGWGLPVGESAWFNRLCVASNRSATPEVCGDLMVYFTPDDVNDLMAKVLLLLQNPAFLAGKEATLQKAQLRTWHHVAKDICQFMNIAI